MRVLATAGFAFCAAIAPALAQDAGEPEIQPLAGTYYMAPAPDAEDPQAPADHIYLTITGDAAKSMWDTMTDEATPDECFGRMAKWAEHLVCYGPGTEMSGPLQPEDSPFECYLGINLKSGSLESSGDC